MRQNKYLVSQAILKGSCLVLTLFCLSFTSVQSPRPRLPDNALSVPIIRQATSYSCGAAALLSVLYYWQVYDDHESSLYELIGTTEKDGTHPRGLVLGAQKFGLKAEMKENMTIEDLSQALDAGSTVILDIQAWLDKSLKDPNWEEIWEDGHYVVLVGFDSKYVYVMDSSAGPGYAYMSQEELVKRWHDYEDRDGYVWRNQHLGVVIHGAKPISKFPVPLVHVD